MAFRGVTFSGQNVTPKNDGALYNAHYGDGILEGCSMAISGDDLVIQSGHIMACGRVCQVDGATSVDLSGRTLQTGYIQVVMNYDLTQGEGQQWYPTFVESATTTFPALTKDDINTPTGELYQLELAVVQISGGNLTSITSQIRLSDVQANRLTAKSDGVILPRFDIYGDDGVNMGSFMSPAYHQGDVRIYGLDNGTQTSGMYMEKGGRLILFGHGDMYIRPNGANNTSGQFYIDTDGQQHGGHSLLTSDNSNESVPYTANTIKSLANIQNLGGVCICLGEISFSPSSSTSTEMELGFGSNNSSFSFENYTPSTTANRKRMQAMCFISGYSSIYLNFRCGVSGTIYLHRLRVIRLA